MILPCLHLHFYHPHLSHQNVSLLVFLYSYSSRVMFKTLIRAKIPQHFLLVYQIKSKLLIVVQNPLYVWSSLNFLLSSLSSRHTLFSSISISKLLLVKSFWVFFFCQDFPSFHLECSLVPGFQVLAGRSHLQCLSVTSSLSPLTHQSPPHVATQDCIQLSLLLCMLPQRLSRKESAGNAGDTGDSGSIPGSGRPPRVGNGNPLLYSFLGESMDRGTWQATVPGVPKSWTRLSKPMQSSHKSPIIYRKWLNLAPE